MGAGINPTPIFVDFHFAHLIATLNFVRACSRSEVIARYHFAHLIATFFPFTM